MPDITISRLPNKPDYIVGYKDDATIVPRALLALIVAGASAGHLSVYDASAGHYLTGTLDQLLNG